MALELIGAGLPRTGTSSLRAALERLLGGRCQHMSAIPGHPFDLGPDWRRALDGDSDSVDWNHVFAEHAATVDWPAAQFWSEIVTAFPNALILLSERESAQLWWDSMDKTVLRVARKAAVPTWDGGRDLLRLLENFAGTHEWDDATLLRQAYASHNAHVRQATDPARMIAWKPGDGWEPLCDALGLPVPDEPFPWLGKRGDW